MKCRETQFGKASRTAGTRTQNRPRAKRSLGQNFLVDDNVARKIVAASCVTEHDVVVEIGPGQGALTKFVLATGALTEAIEKDSNLSRLLLEKFGSSANLNLTNADFLDYSFPSRGTPAKVLGNIPYNLTSSIVSRLVDERKHIQSAVLMVQDEVARRLAAAPGSKDYGAISIRLNLVAKVEKLFLVRPTCFRPKPRVNSRVIRITFIKRNRIEREDAFVSFVKKAFGMRRKMFRHFAAHYYGKESVRLLEHKYLTNRVEVFEPEEIYKLFSILEHDV